MPTLAFRYSGVMHKWLMNSNKSVQAFEPTGPRAVSPWALCLVLSVNESLSADEASL